MSSLRRKFVGTMTLLAGAAVGLMAFAQASQAATVDHWHIITDGINGNIEATVDIEVNDNEVKFTFNAPTSGDDNLALSRVSFEGGWQTLDGQNFVDYEIMNMDTDFAASDQGITNAGDIPGWDSGGNSPGKAFFQINANGLGDSLQKGEDSFMLTLIYDGDLSLDADELAAILNGDGGTTMSLRIVGQWLNCDNGESCGAIAQPLPAALWLFGSALLGLVGIGGYRRRRTAAA